MGEETLDKVQEYLGGHVTPSMTCDHPLLGASGYTQDYWQTLVEEYFVSPATAEHLAHKYGTVATEVLKLATTDPALALPLLEGQAAIRAEVIYAVRSEMAVTVEDVLARRIGLQLFGWQLA